MKFLGTREVRFEEAKEAAAELYATITGDVEEVGGNFHVDCFVLYLFWSVYQFCFLINFIFINIALLN